MSSMRIELVSTEEAARLSAEVQRRQGYTVQPLALTGPMTSVEIKFPDGNVKTYPLLAGPSLWVVIGRQ